MKNNMIITVVMVVIIGALGFFGGMQYQKSQRSNFTAGGQGGGFARRFGQNGQNGQAIRGEIISSDQNSITVKLADGSTKIIILSSSATIGKVAVGTKDN